MIYLKYNSRNILLLLPIPTSGWPNTLDNAVSFESCEVLFHRFWCNSDYFRKSFCAKCAIFGEKHYDFIPAFNGFFSNLIFFSDGV